MKLQIDLDIPEGVIDQKFEKALKEDAVLRLFAERKVPSGQAARLLGLTRLQFLELLTARGIPHLDSGSEEFEADSRAIEEFERRTRLGL